MRGGCAPSAGALRAISGLSRCRVDGDAEGGVGVDHGLHVVPARVLRRAARSAASSELAAAAGQPGGQRVERAAHLVDGGGAGRGERRHQHAAAGARPSTRPSCFSWRSACSTGWRDRQLLGDLLRVRRAPGASVPSAMGAEQGLVQTWSTRSGATCSLSSGAFIGVSYRIQNTQMLINVKRKTPGLMRAACLSPCLLYPCPHRLPPTARRATCAGGGL